MKDMMDKKFGTVDPRIRQYIQPRRIVWQSNGQSAPQQSKRLLMSGPGQPSLYGKPGCTFHCNGQPSGILLDFGCELFGGIQLVVGDTSDHKSVRLRVRFGESVSEAMSELNNGTIEKMPSSDIATNGSDHTTKDIVVRAPWLSSTEVGNIGFRFVRVDMIDEGNYVEIRQIRAVFLCHDLEYKGSFECNDERLNKIWQTGAYTMHLNIQNYIWDGIKRDQMVWIGDMHPEVMIINTVFGHIDVVPRSLDLVRDETPLPGWMNGISSYSLWWILIQKKWYLYHGDFTYLSQQRQYLLALLKRMQKYVNQENMEILPESRFLDWSVSTNKVALHAGLQAMMVLSFKAGAYLCEILGESTMKQECLKMVERLMTYRPALSGNKQDAAMMVLAGMLTDDVHINGEILARDPFRGISPFYGYYVLQARAHTGDYQGCLDLIRTYWGTMLDFGATTFWEDFDLSWTDNAVPIDQLVPYGKRDIHADSGAFGHKGLCHSLCHGWSGGPTAWLSEHVLGLRPLEPGCEKLLVQPNLADLEWAKGTFPTPHGIVKVSHTRDSRGKVQTTIKTPKKIKVVNPSSSEELLMAVSSFFV
jgi:alpha-L-rhamnosidase